MLVCAGSTVATAPARPPATPSDPVARGTRASSAWRNCTTDDRVSASAKAPDSLAKDSGDASGPVTGWDVGDRVAILRLTARLPTSRWRLRISANELPGAPVREGMAGAGVMPGAGAVTGRATCATGTLAGASCCAMAEAVNPSTSSHLGGGYDANASLTPLSYPTGARRSVANLGPAEAIGCNWLPEAAPDEKPGAVIMHRPRHVRFAGRG